MPPFAVEQWPAVLEEIAREVSPERFRTWFSNVELAGHGDGWVEIGVANRFLREWVSRNYREAIERAVARVAGAPLEVRFAISAPLFRRMRERQERPLSAAGEAPPPSDERARPQRSEPASAPAPAAPSTGAFPASARPHPGYTLDRFAVGASNRLAHAAARLVAEEPGSRYNPLVLCGGPGLGKTHLAHAIAGALAGKGLRVELLPAEGFTNAFLASLNSDRIEEMRARLRGADALVVDDLGFLASKTRTQEEFAHTFDALHAQGRQIVVTLDRAPDAVPGFSERLATRLASGLVAGIDPPERETRLAILRALAKRRGLDLGPEVLDLVARRAAASVRHLEGAVLRIEALARAGGARADLALARAALRHLEAQEEGAVTPARILAAAAEHYGVDAGALRAHGRTRALVEPRQVAMFLMRRLTRMSLAEVGSFFEGRDHATVLHAERKVRRLEEASPVVRDALAELSRRLGAGD